MVVGEPNVPVAVPLAESSGVFAVALFHVAVAVFRPAAAVGAAAYVHEYGRVTESLFRTVTLVPPVTVHSPPLLIASVTVAVIDSQSFGLLTVMVPAVVQALSVPLWLTLTV